MKRTRPRLLLLVLALLALYYAWLVFSVLLHVTTPSSPASLPSKPVITITYCVYPQTLREGEPVLGSEYMAKVIGPLIFDKKTYQVETRPCLAIPEQLPRNISATSRQGLYELGLLGAHMRFCTFGVTAVISATLRNLNAAVKLHRFALNESETSKLASKQVRWLGEGGVDAFAHAGRVVGPLLSRTSREPSPEFTPGVPLQFETKAVNHPRNVFTIHMPYAFESFGRSRWNGGDAKRVFEPHGEKFGGNDMFALEESVTRASGFNAGAERAKKRGFMAMVNSNCRFPLTSHIRNVFSYAVFAKLGKPVHNLGLCPQEPRGSVLAGLTPQQRSELKREYRSGSKGHGSSVTEIFKDYKFSICFENSNLIGYASEKLVTPYASRSIPVYWGSGALLGDIFNKRAFVHCDLPNNVTARVARGFLSFCEQKLEEGYSEMDCAEDGLWRALEPWFNACIAEIDRLDRDDAAYEEMLAQPLATVDERGRLTGYWNETKYAEGIRAVFDFFNYYQGPNELERVLSLLAESG